MTYAELKVKMHEYRMGKISKAELILFWGEWQVTDGWKYRRLINK